MFVCSGNQCRSPMAEKMFEKMLEREGFNEIEVHSSGTAATGGEWATEVVQKIAAQMGLDLTDHCARPLSAEVLQECHLILVMEEGHQALILAMCPDLEGRVKLLSSYMLHGHAGDEILDPTGMSQVAHRSCFARIMESLEGLLIVLREDR